MSYLAYPDPRRSNVIVVIDGLLSEQLADLGQHIENLNLPVLPIVTLVKTVPIVGTHLAEEKQLEAKHDLATAKVSLNAKVSRNINAGSEIVQGSNPMNAVNFFTKGPFDAMIKRGSNGEPAIIVKNFEAPGISELAKLISVKDLSEDKAFQQSISAAKDLSEHKASQHSYKGLFAKPPKQPQRNIIAKRPSVTLQQPETLKPKI